MHLRVAEKYLRSKSSDRELRRFDRRWSRAPFEQKDDGIAKLLASRISSRIGLFFLNDLKFQIKNSSMLLLWKFTSWTFLLEVKKIGVHLKQINYETQIQSTLLNLYLDSLSLDSRMTKWLTFLFLSLRFSFFLLWRLTYSLFDIFFLSMRNDESRNIEAKHSEWKNTIPHTHRTKHKKTLCVILPSVRGKPLESFYENNARLSVNSRIEIQRPWNFCVLFRKARTRFVQTQLHI